MNVKPCTDTPATCTINLVDEITEDRERLVRNIRNLLPLNISESGTSDGGDIDRVYRDLAQTFNRNTSSKGHDRFVAAVDEIFVAYRDECADVTGVPTREDITNLAASFREVKRTLNRAESLTRARSIYGRFLCYNELTELHPTGRAKRQAFIGLPSACVDHGCPELITEPCHFFACLDVSDVVHITGFGNTYESFDSNPCIAFIVDTTGSMAVEIAAARRVVLQFMRSQADSTSCYLLVPFNDYVDYHHLYTEIPPGEFKIYST